MEDQEGEAARSPISPRLRLAVLVGVIVLGSLAFVIAGTPSPDEVRDQVAQLGPAAPLAWIVIYAALTVAFFPGSISTAASGLLFGPVLGTLTALVGATIGATGAFMVGRGLGRDQVAAIAGPRLQRLDAMLSERGLLAVLYLRLIPLVPFNAFNYGAGVTALARRDFVLGTAIGIIPGTFAYAALGGSLDDVTSPLGLTAIGLVVVLAVAGPLLSKRFGVGTASASGSTGDGVTSADAT